MAYETYHLVTPAEKTGFGGLDTLQVEAATRELRRGLNGSRDVAVLTCFDGLLTARKLMTNLRLFSTANTSPRIDQISQQPRIVERPSEEFAKAVAEDEVKVSDNTHLVVVTTPFFMAAIGHGIADLDQARAYESHGEVVRVEEGDSFQNPLFSQALYDFVGPDIEEAITHARAQAA